MSELPNPAPLMEAAGEVETPSPARQRQEMIRAGVLAALGRPTRLLKVVVVSLWGNHFRVNVWRSPDTSTQEIAHSFFVTADERGTILRSDPPIRKQY
jgi:hypothetical protein